MPRQRPRYRQRPGCGVWTVTSAPNEPPGDAARVVTVRATKASVEEGLLVPDEPSLEEQLHRCRVEQQRDLAAVQEDAEQNGDVGDVHRITRVRVEARVD